MEKDRVSAVPPIENLIVTLMQLNIKVGIEECVKFVLRQANQFPFTNRI